MARRSLRDIFVRKSVEQMHDEHEHGELKRSLGATNLVLLGIGCIIGTGIFVLTGRAAAQFAGPAIIISFIITGTLCALVALSYAELASAIPVSGSAYSYSYASLGEIAAWIMGVLLVLEYGLAASTVAVGWSGYVASFLHDFGLDIPPALRGALGTSVTDFVTGAVVGTGVVNLPAVIAIAAVIGLLILGVSESAFVNNIVVAIKVTVVVAFIAIGAFYVNPALWSPLVPAAVPPAAEGRRALEPDRLGALGRRDGAEHGPVRNPRNHHGGGDDLLRLHRLRSGFDGRGGIAESEAGHADRDSGIADHLHDPLHPHVGRPRRHRAVHGSQRRRADREGRQPNRPPVVRHAREDRRHRRVVLGHARAAVRSDAHLLHDGARRPDSARVLEGPPEVQDAVDQYADRRSARMRFRGLHGARPAREPHQRRHVARVCDRLHHRHLSALRASRHAARSSRRRCSLSRRCSAQSCVSSC